MFNIHPNKELVSLFKNKPYQGAHPDDCTYLFIGLDANYSENIEESSIFIDTIDYHKDGVNYWKETGVHHPFLKCDHNIDGKRYHLNFSKIGFSVEDAEKISFVELLNVPTYGRNSLTIDDLDEDHLKILNQWIINGNAKYIFLPNSVAKLMYKTKLFTWLPKSPMVKGENLNVYYENKFKKVFSHLHFSVYGKDEARRVHQAKLIKQLLG